MTALLRTLLFALVGAPAIALANSLLVRAGLKVTKPTGAPGWRGW